MKPFTYPETNNSRALSGVIKSRKLPDGTYEACAAMFFEGKRLRQQYAIDKSRSVAMRLAHKGIW
jgi:hypothetical protein